jgi:energy-coupling factor transporter ATP-binding protein EcfA2
MEQSHSAVSTTAVNRGKVLLIIGKQGSGKSTLAKRLAQWGGTPYLIVTEEELLNPFILSEEPKTLIVEEYKGRSYTTIRKMLESDTIVRHKTMVEDKTIPTPRIICVSGLSADAFMDHRGFVLHEIGGAV